MITDQTAAVLYDSAYYPWGQGWQQDTSSDWNVRFAGMRSRDGNTGLDLTLFRRYDSFLGRWLTPDKLGGDITDPQSLNRYAYVLNNPATLTDPLGLFVATPPTYYATNLGAPCWNMDGYGCGYNFTSYYGYGSSGGSGGGVGTFVGRGIVDTPVNLLPPGPVGDPGCTLVAPGGDYSLGPNAVALFQPPMASALTSAFQNLNSRNIVPMINSGFRTPADQLRMRNGASGPNPAAVISWHEVGMAVDINGTTSSYFPVIVGAMQRQGLTWGGTFVHRDLPHFQLPPAGTSPTAAMVSACGGH